MSKELELGFEVGYGSMYWYYVEVLESKDVEITEEEEKLDDCPYRGILTMKVKPLSNQAFIKIKYTRCQVDSSGNDLYEIEYKTYSFNGKKWELVDFKEKQLIV